MKKLLLFFHIISGVIFSQQLTIKPDTLFKSNFQISNQIISRDRDGKLYIAFTCQTGTNISSKEIFYAVQESDSFIIKQATNNFSEDINSSLFISEDGKLHLIFLSRDSENIMQLYYMNNVSGKFSKRIQLTKSPVNKIAPKAVIDRLGMIHIVYFTNSFSDNQICYKAFSTNNFSISNDIVLCNGETDHEYDAAIAADERDKIHIAVKSGSVKQGKLKYFSNSTGLIKEVQLEIEENICSPQIIFNNKILNIFYKNTDDQRLYRITRKRDFGSPYPITPENHNPTGFRNCSIDETGRIYLIYQNLESNDLKNLYLIHLREDQHSLPVNLCCINDNSMTGDVSFTAYSNGVVSFLLSSNLRKEISTSSNLIYSKSYIFGNAVINSSGNLVNFGERLIDDVCEESIKISNEGTTALKIFSPSISDNNFSAEPFDTLTVLPDSSAELKVYFNPTDTLEYTSNLILSTNAANSKTITFKLTGKGTGFPEILTDRDTIFIYNRKEFADSILIVNTGSKVLIIDSVSISGQKLKPVSAGYIMKPEDSVYIPLELKRNKTPDDISAADTIAIYSNDPHEMIKYIIVQSADVVTADQSEAESIETYELYQNYPNPFNPSTTISFFISGASYISLAVYDALAREIAELAEGFFPAGRHNVSFSADDLSTGIYYYKLRVKSGEKKAPDYVEVRKMMLIK